MYICDFSQGFPPGITPEGLPGLAKSIAFSLRAVFIPEVKSCLPMGIDARWIKRDYTGVGVRNWEPLNPPPGFSI